MNKLWKSGDPYVWITGGALALCLLMVAGLVLLILVNGMGYFWAKDVIRYELDDGAVVAGSLVEREPVPDSEKDGEFEYRILLKRANRDIYGSDFIWVDEARISGETLPSDLTVFERREWGDLIAVIREVRDGEAVLATGPEAGYRTLRELLPGSLDLVKEIRSVELNEIGKNSAEQERARLRLRGLSTKGVTEGPEVDRLNRRIEAIEEEFLGYESRLADLRKRQTLSAVVTTADGTEKVVPFHLIVRAYRPNGMGLASKLGFYAAKVGEFIWDNPRESNTEGGIFPAIFGTVVMVFLMSLVVAPLGVLAAYYLREYSKQGPLVSIVRIMVNNLAGVPSIVFGVFGVGFFIYFIGGSIDSFFFSEALPTPTFGTGGILWASLTLALLTVPVVIVATEEGLAAIPDGLREASFALGATKFETTWRVVTPSVMPSILTGLILAMARAAGEVAPLMITGVVKLAPALPVDGTFPYVHLDRKFMHLGFHIYDVGFQSPNVDAARPMVFATALLLILIVLFLNLAAIALRNRLKKRFQTAAV